MLRAQRPRRRVISQSKPESDLETLSTPPHTPGADSMTTVAAIPAFNEEKAIGSIVLSAKRYVDEVVVVDDGSTDETAWIAEQAGAKVVRHPVNRGYGAAIRSCFDYARNNRAEALVILDGDGQHRPHAIPLVLRPVTEGQADICIGSRFLEPNHAAVVPRYRRFGIRFLTGLANLKTRRNGALNDAQSGFRAYSRKAIEEIDPLETNMGASVEILWDADRRGLKIVEVPLEVYYDREDSTKKPLRHGLSVIGTMVRYVETEHPLLFFGVPGFVLFVLGVTLGIFVIQGYYQTLSLAVGLALITVLFLVLGTLLSFTGLILHAVLAASRRFR